MKTPDKKKTARVLSSEMLFRGRVFELRRDRVAEPSGIEATREFIVHPGSVVVIPANISGNSSPGIRSRTKPRLKARDANCWKKTVTTRDAFASCSNSFLLPVSSLNAWTFLSPRG